LNAGTEPPENDITETELLTFTSLIRVPPTVWFDGELQHDDTIEVEIGCSVDFIVNAHDCNAEDIVSLYVLEDPGLPNGATVEALTNPDDNLFNAQRDFSWTPDYAQGGKTYRVCFIARDNSDICELNGWYSRDEVCVNIAVGNVQGLEWAEATGASYDTTIGCATDVDISVSETNGYCIQPIEFQYASRQESSYKGSDFVGTELPDTISVSSCIEEADDACLGCDIETGISSCSVTVTHSPVRGDEGTATEVCFTAQDIYGVNKADSMCLRFNVPTCKYCVQAGETLHDFANIYAPGTTWLRLWNTNPSVRNPDSIFEDSQELYVGIEYQTQQGDTIRALSTRFATTDHSIIDLNPQLEDEQEELTPGHPICLTPCTNKPDGELKTYTWGY
jgi:hypothetical protein